MLTPEQSEEIKRQLVDNISKNFPEDKRQFAIDQINSMSPEQLEEFMKKNNLQTSAGDGSSGNCVFCSIASKTIQSYPIGENSEAVAVLEINPVSRGHTLIIPKIHSENNEESPGAKNLSEKISKQIETILKPKQVSIENSTLFGHQIINLVPQYEDTLVSLKSQKSQAKPEELSELQTQLTKENSTPEQADGALHESSTKEKPKKPRTKRLTEKNTWLPKRIP